VIARLSETRDVEAAKQFFAQAFAVIGKPPQHVTTNGHAADPRPIHETLGEQVLHRCSPYVKNRLEQDHRRVKQRVRPMLGVKRVDHAWITISGVELIHQIKTAQCKVSFLCLPSARTPQVWDAVLAA
jgi:transposase-like protein